ncbi:type I 3-dehydroquinate dehydratase [Pseudomonas sp. HR96]|uniref:type I 3-dehydroquinate dehydratase n=1 Tax=Pseudomonas sp. HR96 TaxID=1027966 RepID=UPI002A758E95|nr:type I 3-dehydroquinate dehydratase [Pseudomonas sp. HR96]WPP01417.1 type I 3-dehydroquinate dehydratase [Pseudomonas sp. HR96]
MQRREFLIKTGLAAATVPLSDVLLAAPEPGQPAPPNSTPRATAILQIKDLEIGKGAPKIIASITASSADQALQQADAIARSGQVDLAELRMDYLPNPGDHAAMLDLIGRVTYSLQGKPLLATWRSQQEGGKQPLSDDEYFALYRAIVEGASVDLIDLEMSKPEAQVTALVDAAHGRDIAVILSNHDFNATPQQAVIVERLRRQQALGADILKIATMPNSPADVLTLMAASQEMFTRYAERPLLTMSMGPLGVTSRVAGQLTGSALTYASVGQASAPGQLQADSVRSVLQIIDQGSRA